MISLKDQLGTISSTQIQNIRIRHDVNCVLEVALKNPQGAISRFKMRSQNDYHIAEIDMHGQAVGIYKWQAQDPAIRKIINEGDFVHEKIITQGNQGTCKHCGTPYSLRECTTHVAQYTKIYYYQYQMDCCEPRVREKVNDFSAALVGAKRKIELDGQAFDAHQQAELLGAKSLEQKEFIRNWKYVPRAGHKADLEDFSREIKKLHLRKT